MYAEYQCSQPRRPKNSSQARRAHKTQHDKMDSSDANPDSSEERLSSEEDPVDDPKDADFEVPDDDDEDEEEEEFMEEDEAPPRRRRSLPRGQPEEEEDAPPRRRRSATKLNEDEVDESTEEPPPRRRSSTKLAEDEDEPTEEPPPEPTEEPPKVPPAIRDHNTAPEAQEEPVYTDTGRRKRSAAKKVNYDDSVRDKDFFRAVNKHDADKYPDNGHISEGDDDIIEDDTSDSDGPRRATAKKWKEPVEKKKKRATAQAGQGRGSSRSWIRPTAPRRWCCGCRSRRMMSSRRPGPTGIPKVLRRRRPSRRLRVEIPGKNYCRR